MRVENSVSNGVWLGSERLTVGGLAGIYRFGFISREKSSLSRSRLNCAANKPPDQTAAIRPGTVMRLKLYKMRAIGARRDFPLPSQPIIAIRSTGHDPSVLSQ